MTKIQNLPATTGVRRFILVAVGCLALGGCTLAPAYHRPDAPIPNIYAARANGTEAPEMVAWKQFFTDPGMQACIQLALENNRDLRVALLNIEKTRQQYRIQRADLLPTVNAVGSHTSQRVPSDMSQLPSQDAYISRQYTASLGFSGYELDLFGRVRSLTEAALEGYYSVEMDGDTARLSLVAETAALYLQLVADQELLDITEATYQNRKQQLVLVERQAAVGTASELALNQAKSAFEEARIFLAQYKTKVGQDENYLSLLLGGASLPPEVKIPRRLADVALLQDVPEGMPSTLLERRPDIRSAEYRLKAANANIGAARANFFPSISITGSIGSLTPEYDNLFTGSARTWTFMPQVYLPIFDTGRNIARLGVSEAERDIAVASYEKTIQSAFREVADALVQRENIGEQLKAETERLAAATRTYTLAGHRYSAGIDNMLTLLDAQRTLYGAEQSYIGTRLLREGNALTLYKALGGGWY